MPAGSFFLKFVASAFLREEFALQFLLLPSGLRSYAGTSVKKKLAILRVLLRMKNVVGHIGSYSMITVTFMHSDFGFCVINGCSREISHCVNAVDELKHFSAITPYRVLGSAWQANDFRGVLL